MTIRCALLSILLLSAASRTGAQPPDPASPAATPSGNVTTYRAGGAYDTRRPTGGYNDYNRYPDRRSGGDSYNRPPQQRGWREPAATPPDGATGANTRRKRSSYNTAPTPRPHRHDSSGRPRRESSDELRQRYRTPGVVTPGLAPGYRSPYDGAPYRDHGAPGYRGTENPGYGQSNGGRPRRPVQPLEDGALPEGASDDAHAITR